MSGDGTYVGAIPVPGDLPPGTYTLQVNGLTDNTRQRAVDTRAISISILVKVTELVVEGKTVRTIVDFPVSSVKLTNPAKRQLDALIKRLPESSKRIIRLDSFAGSNVLGDSTISLSGARARSVEGYLRSKGIRGEYDIKDGATADRILSTYILVRVTGLANKPVSKPANKPTSKPAIKPANKQDAVRGGIQFDAYSAALTKSAKGELNLLLKQLPTKSNNFVRVVGFVGPGGSVNNAKTLSKARSESVARYLRSKGIRGEYDLTAGGSATSLAPAAQRTKITIFPNQKS